MHQSNGLAHLRVLVADDNVINCKVVTCQLAQLGIAADVVNDGSAAVQLSADRTYDLLLLDCHMPVMDGFAASRAIREREQRMGSQRMQIIACTANASAEAERQCIEAGMDGYLVKPVALERLLNIYSLR
jgi:CheY-like chemotaxis protein